MTKYDATQKVLRLIIIHNKDEVAKLIGISRPTLDSRLNSHKWKVSELTHISKL